MTEAVASLGIGIAVGYLSQRSRLCFVGGFRDWLLFRETSLLTGVLAFALTAWVAWPLAALLGGVVGPLPGVAFASLSAGLAVGGGLLLGLASVLANGCPLRQHVLAGQGRGDSWAYLAGFAAGALAFRYLMLLVVIWGL
ncbi:MAG TPA: YeeE/YedE thiosulfate transporter family protein [Symbiobacteriaceae bacterium]